jgi:hypothetical protein
MKIQRQCGDGSKGWMRGKAGQDLCTVGRPKEAWLGCAETGQKYMQAANEKSRNGGDRVVSRD